MTIEEIELRKVIKEMLSDAGINRNTLKTAVKEVLEEKITKTIRQICQEHDIDSFIEKETREYFDKYIEGYVCNDLVDKIQNELKDKIVRVDFHLSRKDEWYED